MELLTLERKSFGTQNRVNKNIQMEDYHCGRRKLQFPLIF